jgi:hypothetical protein
MANVYNRGKKWLMDEDLVAVGAAGKLVLMLMTITYVYNESTHDDRADITANECTRTSYAPVALTTVTSTENDGTNQAEARADRVAFGALESGDEIGSGVIFHQVGGAPAGTDPLICYIELPNTPTNGQAFSVDFSGADPGIFLTYDDAP